MSRLRSFSGLKWVGSELDEVIRKARDALEEYVEGGGETAVLGPCVEQLHQVHGVLEMLELRGAGLLAEEMQVSAQALKDGQASSPTEASEALMLAMIQLPDYLEKLEAGGADIPLVLLPAINDLRASRGVSPLSETDLVVSRGVTASPSKIADERQIHKLRRAAHQARLRLHKGMLGWFRGSPPEEGLGTLRDVFEELEEHAVADPALRGLFRTAHAVAEGLLDRSIESDTQVKGLIGRVDRVIKQLGSKGVHAAHQVVEQGVLRELLQLVSRSDSPHPTILAVKTEYDLERAFPSEDELAQARQRMLAPNAGALAGMRSAAVKELLPIKDTLDLYMRSGREQTEQLLGLEEPMLRLANTLDMVSLADLSKRLRNRAQDIKSIGSGELSVDDALLMGIAGDLLYVESSLENIQRESGEEAQSAALATTQVPQGELQRLISKTLEEAAVEMAKAKEAIVVYITSPADTRPLEATPAIFHGVAGALRVISKNEAAEVLDQIRDFIKNSLITRSVVPEQRMLDSLAEAITGIEYYMEAVGEGRRDTGDILNIARSALGRLEYAPKVEVEQPLPETEEPEPAAAEMVEITPQISEAMEEVVAEKTPPIVQPQPTEEIDPEILEIFLEEAREEEPVVRDCYRRWRETPGDTEALTTLRRSFHTLKGSGRMVGALTVGEFAWSIENLLNRIIDQTVQPSSEINVLMDQAVAALPELINAQEEGRPAQIDTATLMATAETLAGKKTVQEEKPRDTSAPTAAKRPATAEEVSSFIVEDSELFGIFEAEAREHLSTLYAFLDGCGQQPLPCGFHDELVRSLHTLAGSARMIGIGPLAAVAKALEVKASSSLDQGLGADTEFLGYLTEGTDAIKIMVDALGDPSVEPPLTDELVARIENYVPGKTRTTPSADKQVAPSSAETEEVSVAEEDRKQEEISLELAESSFIIDIPEKEEVQEEGEEESIPLEELEGLLPSTGISEEEISLEGLEEVVPTAEAPEEEEISLEDLEEVVPAAEVPEEEEISLEGLEEVVPAAEVPEEEEISLEVLEEVVPTAEAPEEEEILLEGLEEVVPTAEAPEEEEISLEGLEEVVPTAEAPEEEEISLEGLEEVVSTAEAPEEEGVSLEGLKDAVPAAEILEEQEVSEESPEEAVSEIPVPDIAAIVSEKLAEAELEEAEEPATRFEEVVADQELVEIFVEEAKDLLDSLDTDLHELEMVPDDAELANQLQRTLHTLKGGARLAGVQSVGDLSHAMERLVEAIATRKLGDDQVAHLALVQKAADLLSVQLNAVEMGQPVPLAAGLIEEIQYAALPSAESGAAVEVEAQEQTPVEIPSVPPIAQVVREEDTEQVSSDRELLEIFLEEAQELLDQLDIGLRAWEINPDDNQAAEQLMRNLHTLKGGARMASIHSIGSLSHALETLLSGATPDMVRSQPTLMPLAQHALDQLAGQIENVRLGQPVYRASDLVAELELVHQEMSEAAGPGAPAEEAVIPTPSPMVRKEETEEVSGDQELLEIFLEEAQELLDQLDNRLREWDRAPDDQQAPEELKRHLHTLKGGARMAGIESVGNLSHALETLLSGVTPEVVKSRAAIMQLAQQALDQLAEQIENVRQGLPVYRASDLIAELELTHQEMSGALESEVPDTEPIAPSPPVTAREEEVEEVSGDRELLEIFLEEAQELLDQLDNGLREWDGNPNDQETADELKRNLHTLKGGARMAGIQSVGNLSHALETLLSGVTPNTIKSEPTLVPLAQRALDRLSEQMECVKQGRPVPLAAALVAELEAVHGQMTGAGAPEATVVAPAEETTGPGKAEKETVVSLRKVVAPEAVPPVVPQPVQEQVRVRSDLLNRLVNNSGEISIYRARLEQQNTTLGFNLGELEQTVTRLHDQLRQMEIETEAQILYRYEQEHEEGTLMGDEALDPLELDRFSTIQQLSRSLMETVNDLASIKNLLNDQQKETETLLLQQSRISNDLQDGLLRTRMVPFTQLDPRLRRVVRQTANSIGKRAVLEVVGGEGEMDRSILDRMLAPLEHILRNAVSHGIESPENRKAAGKSETGRVSIYLTREGNDVIITVSDDGAGLNLQAIRRRAEETGLLEKGARIDDDDLMQLVLEPGFSTVKEVTQIAGRGVGTDVVVSEVKQLGGSLEIDSQPGHGTSFSIRLPFTLAITESLLVEIGDDMFAVPHPTMEGVVRISSDDLARSYDGRAPYFSYAGHDYHVRYLGALLGTASLVSMPEGRKWLPLLLVRAGEHRVAIQVDRILGNRQVVVKSVGPQLSSVRWISGGTILPDGRVALILDVSALVRMDVVQATQAEEMIAPEEEERPTRVMVVDDSITVRKVTTRLLKRHNMEVTTAKDGVDAVALLQEEHPDVMLLDIEMPRMDGYELARHMRSSVELQDIPIIMITSRSGEKHRNIAFSLGVKRYLGKPYQETELLDTIYSVLAEVEVEAEA